MNFIKIIKERKLIDGKIYRKHFIDSEGKEIGIPQGVYIDNTACIGYVRVRPDKVKYPDSFGVRTPFHDKRSQEQAFKKSISIIGTLSANSVATSCSTRGGRQKTPPHPTFDIDTSELPTGIIACVDAKRRLVLTIRASYFDASKGAFRQKTLYVGTANTWKPNYARKLQEAVAIREESLKIHEKLTKGIKP